VSPADPRGVAADRRRPRRSDIGIDARGDLIYVAAPFK
jgi:hypothetical protein